MDDILAGLNEAQRRAACHGDGPLLILAGAGTGKTRTLAHRVAHLIEGGTQPGRILLLTFTRRAAAEMLRRADGIVRQLGGGGRGVSAKVWGGTFHSIAARLLRLHGRSIALEPDFTIHDRSDAEDLLNVLRSELGLAKRERRFPSKSTAMDIYSRCVNARKPLADVLETAFPWCRDDADDLKRLFRAYVDRKAEQAVLDYDDLLLFWHGLLGDEHAGAAVRSRFDCVLVDEYQDTNALQAETLALLRPGGDGLTVVGDDAQSIYSFRAATVRNILDFPQVFPGTTQVTLEQNYRSTPPILTATNCLIAEAAERHVKELWSKRQGGARPALVTCRDEDEQTEAVLGQILEHRESGIALRKQAVLFRAAHHSLALEVELGRRNIPFHKYGGLKFVEAAHVKDLLAFLRLAENPRDSVAGLRVLCLLPGIGPRRAMGLLARLATTPDGFACWVRVTPPEATAAVWEAFVALMQRLAGTASDPLGTQIGAVRAFFTPLAEQRYDNAAARLRDLEQLEQLAGRFADRSTLLAELTLDPPSSSQDLAGPPHLDDDFLILSTMHSAKGLEWDAVYVIHASDGNIPSDMATGSPDEIEEERRLFYVALTRAKNWLSVYVPQRYYFHSYGRSDAHSYAQPSRFLSEPVRACFDCRAAERDSETTDAPVATVTSTDIRKQVRALWA